jgi:hypothetical protein
LSHFQLLSARANGRGKVMCIFDEGCHVAA